jgi:hypothetical protein
MPRNLPALTCLLILSTVSGASVAEPPPPPRAAGATPPVAAATPPAAPAPAKPPAAGTGQSSPDRIDPSENVRADSEVSFPVDI